MFLPDAAVLDERKIAGDRRRQAFRNIERWALELMPEAIRDAAVISSQEILCENPSCSDQPGSDQPGSDQPGCAPTETAVSIVFERSNTSGMMGLQMEAYEVTKEELANKFPTKDVLEKWHRGEEAEWPPYDDRLPQLRFAIDTKVLCRIGPDPETDWAPGIVVQLWYREKVWPEGSFAPYKIKLDDGRQIFAPGDIDQVIREQQ